MHGRFHQCVIYIQCLHILAKHRCGPVWFKDERGKVLWGFMLALPDQGGELWGLWLGYSGRAWPRGFCGDLDYSGSAWPRGFCGGSGWTLCLYIKETQFLVSERFQNLLLLVQPLGDAWSKAKASSLYYRRYCCPWRTYPEWEVTFLTFFLTRQ